MVAGQIVVRRDGRGAAAAFAACRRGRHTVTRGLTLVKPAAVPPSGFVFPVFLINIAQKVSNLLPVFYGPRRRNFETARSVAPPPSRWLTIADGCRGERLLVSSAPRPPLLAGDVISRQSSQGGGTGRRWDTSG